MSCESDAVGPARPCVVVVVWLCCLDLGCIWAVVVVLPLLLLLLLAAAAAAAAVAVVVGCCGVVVLLLLGFGCEAGIFLPLLFLRVGGISFSHTVVFGD